jgi:hypothetical protein
VAIVRFSTPGEREARAWTDELIDASRADPPTAGLLAAHFHVASDGRAVMNYAEWCDPAAHEAALSSRSERSAAAAVVDGASAVRFAGVRRYTRWRSIPAHAAPG